MRRTLLSALASVALLPLGWPHHLLLGVTDSPGDAAHLVRQAHVDARYQYLSGRRQHGTRLGDLEPERDVRLAVRARVDRRPPDPGVQLLPAAAVDALDRRLRGAEGPLQPAQPGDDAGLLGGLRAPAAPRRGLRRRPPRGHPHRARPVGLPRAGPMPARWHAHSRRS